MGGSDDESMLLADSIARSLMHDVSNTYPLPSCRDTYAKLLQLASWQATNRRAILWVTVDDGGADNAWAKACLLDGVVDDLATLGVAGDGDFGAGAVL